jgi:hypothetical protein
MNGERQQRISRRFSRRQKSFRYARIFLGRRKIAEGSTMKWEDGRTVFIPGAEMILQQGLFGIVTQVVMS